LNNHGLVVPSSIRSSVLSTYGATFSLFQSLSSFSSPYISIASVSATVCALRECHLASCCSKVKRLPGRIGGSPSYLSGGIVASGFRVGMKQVRSCEGVPSLSEWITKSMSTPVELMGDDDAALDARNRPVKRSLKERGFIGCGVMVPRSAASNSCVSRNVSAAEKW
jgi:hypothetical protein